VFQLNNDSFMDAFEEVLEKMKTVKSGFALLDFAVNQMITKETRETAHGPNIQMRCSGTFPVTSMSTYVRCAENKEDIKENFRTVAETGATLPTTTEGEGRDEY
jgi:hypothetical protein